MDPEVDLIDTPEKQLRRIFAHVTGSKWLRRLCGALFNRPDAKQTDAYLSAQELKNTFKPENDVDYEWVLRQARFNYEQLLSSNEALDEKAEKLIALFAGGSGLLSVGAILKLSEVNAYVAMCWGIALLFGVLAVIVGGLVRFPKEAMLPPTAEHAVLYANSHKARAEVRFIGQWHLVCEFLKIRNARKADGLKLAFWLGTVAVIVLLVSFWLAFATIDQSKTLKIKETISMASDSKSEAPPPDPVPEVPVDPTLLIEPQVIHNTPDPVRFVEPQTIQESHDPEE